MLCIAINIVIWFLVHIAQPSVMHYGFIECMLNYRSRTLEINSTPLWLSPCSVCRTLSQSPHVGRFVSQTEVFLWVLAFCRQTYKQRCTSLKTHISKTPSRVKVLKDTVYSVAWMRKTSFRFITTQYELVFPPLGCGFISALYMSNLCC